MTALIFYNKDLRKAEQLYWKDYCQGIEDVPYRARLMKIMSSQPTGWDTITFRILRIQIPK
jgi:hypothetical protein